MYPDVNWQDEILHKTSFQQTYYVSAQGGGSIARYFVSMGMSKESAAYIQDPDSRYKAGQGVGSIATVLLNLAAGNYGGASADAAIAAMGVVNRKT